ncbi:hypothetical protein BGX28_003674 [Mortierella sp. GBA30]|nr:hypothetical protein BGX28_003674 [Mortierella sp. GBA30]
MSGQKDAAPIRANEQIMKRPANFTVRHDFKRDTESKTMSGMDSKFIPPEIIGQPHQQQSQQQQHAHTTGLSLAGVCTVRIGPHMFLDTKFYTLSTPLNRALQDPSIKLEPPSDTSRLHHQVVMEFKENPGTTWLFPQEASLELTPASDGESAQISASFSLPIPEKREQGGQRIGASTQAINLVILQATTALWEGLQMAVSGTHTTVHRSSINHYPHNYHPHQAAYDPHTPSTDDDEDPSEILGSGKNSSNTTLSAKIKRPDISEQDKTSKAKRSKNQEDKEPGSPVKKSLGAAGGSGGISAAKRGAGSSSNATSQKRCGYCGCTSTPMWRRGPHGPSTLCNACGVKWKHGKIMQDSKDATAQISSGSASASSSKAGSGGTASAQRAPGLKANKRSSENGHDRNPDSNDRKANSKASCRKTSVASSGNDLDTAERSSSSRESSNSSRSVDLERIVPVKKRHLNNVTPTRLAGPRMVPIHELDNVTRTPTRPTAADKHEDRNGHDNEDEERLLLSGRAKRRKNGFEQANHRVSSSSSSASTASTMSDALEISSNRDNKDRDRQIESKLQSQQIDPRLELLDDMPDAAEELSLYSKNLYTNNTATFPLHFPTISIGFGPNNAYYTYPNCAVVLFENHFQIKLIQAGERTEIDVWKEGIEGTEFQVVDVGDGESMIVMKALLRQYLTRFDKELLNPDRNESLIVFRFRERLDGGGPCVKPLLEHWLATDIPVPPPPTSDSA